MLFPVYHIQDLDQQEMTWDDFPAISINSLSEFSPDYFINNLREPIPVAIRGINGNYDTDLHDIDPLALSDTWSMGTDFDNDFNNLANAVSPRTTSAIYSPHFMSSELTPFNARALINEWNNYMPSNPLPTIEENPIEWSAEASTLEVGAAESAAVPGFGEILAANQIGGQLMGNIFDQSYNVDLQNAQTFVNSNMRYGAGSSMNESNYMSAVNSQVSQEKSNMAIGSAFGPLGSAIAAGINANLTPINVDLDTTFSTGGYMSNGTSAASANTSTSAPST